MGRGERVDGVLSDRPIAAFPGCGEGAVGRGLRAAHHHRPLRRLSLARRAPTAVVLVSRDPPVRQPVRAGRRLRPARTRLLAGRHWGDRRSPRVSRARRTAELARGSAATAARGDPGAARAWGPWPSSEDPPVLRRPVGRVRRALDLLRGRRRASPTNNVAERALRHGVLLRKIQLGTQSENGNRWIERICTARETCRLQGRSVLGYLQAAATAAHYRQPIPSLTPT